MMIGGYLRIVVYRGVTHLYPVDLIPIINDFYNDEISWTIPVKQIKSQLTSDFTTIIGPEQIINGYHFVMKLKRSRDNLYFGIWYQNNKKIENTLRSEIEAAYDTDTANKAIEAFNFITEDEEFDDIPLIIHDMEDPTYSCILEHVEQSLENDATLILRNDQIADITQKIKQIIHNFNPTKSIQDSFIFRVRYECVQVPMTFCKLYRFDTNQVLEKGAELHWRHKYNNYKDISLNFNKLIKNQNKLTFKCRVDILEQFHDESEERKTEQEHILTWTVKQDKKKKLKEMKHGDYLYLFEEKTSMFGVFVGRYHMLYQIFLQRLYPNMQQIDDGIDIMDTEITSAIFKINDVQYGKTMTNSNKFDAEDDIIIVGKIYGQDWIDLEKDKDLAMKMEITF